MRARRLGSDPHGEDEEKRKTREWQCAPGSSALGE